VIHKVDYLSYTYYGDEDNRDHDWHPTHDYLRQHLPPYIETDGGVSAAPHRLGFEFGIGIDNHTYVWVSKTGLILIEHTGAGCDRLEARGLLLGIIQSRADRVTRIDIATDILTDVRPHAFVSERTPSRLSAHGHVYSKFGETEYIGSRKSERTCKVYRYDGDHPRAKFLRIEYTYKRQDAKIIAHQLWDTSIEQIALASGERYQWQHEAWRSL